MFVASQKNIDELHAIRFRVMTLRSVLDQLLSEPKAKRQVEAQISLFYKNEDDHTTALNAYTTAFTVDMLSPDNIDAIRTMMHSECERQLAALGRRAAELGVFIPDDTPDEDEEVVSSDESEEEYDDDGPY